MQCQINEGAVLIYLTSNCPFENSDLKGKTGCYTGTNGSHQTVELLTGLCVDLAKAVVAHLVHEAVEQNR